MKLLCKIFGHKWGKFSVVVNGVEMKWYTKHFCKRCNIEI